MTMATEAYDTVIGAVIAGAELARGVAIGSLTGFDDAGRPMVDRPDVGITQVAARSIVPLDELFIGCDVALLFEGGDPTRPIVIGVLQDQQLPPERDEAELSEPLPIEVEADGQRVVLTGREEVVLRCGKASIQLLSDGTIRLRGTNVLSRASATNRIRGGSVQIN
jgi:hypothetical protein